MARKTLVVFFLVMAIAYGLVALAGTWKPTLGLDLQGGTSITLRAEGDPGEEALDQARQIIDDRVNGSGVAEAEVTTQGGNEIVVEIPGENARNLIETVQRTAQLRFRLVACSTVDGRCATTTGLPEGIQIDPSTTLPQDEGQDGGQDGDESQGRNNRAALGAWARLSDTQGDGADGSDGSGGQGDENSNGNRNRNGNGQQSPYDACVAAAADDETTAEPLSWIDNPTTACVDAFSQFQASGGCQQGAAPVMGDDPAAPLITCDEDGIAYLLSPAMIEGTQLDDAGAAIPQQQVNYVVTLSFDGEGTEVFADISNALVGTEKQFAIVLDGQVLSAPTMEGRILDGNAQISGDFNETTANSLATSLRYGSLPIAFEDQPLVETIGPSLAGDQLSAGLTAGGIGLAIVMLYCLLYYRGLGTVVVASLFVAAGITYAMVLLLSETANFLLVHPPDGLVAGQVPLLQQGAPPVGPEPRDARCRAHRHRRERLMGRFAQLGNDLHSGRRGIDFVARRLVLYAVSVVLIAIAVFGLSYKGLNLGIEFTGGTQYRVPVAAATQDDADALRQAVLDSGVEGASNPIVSTAGDDAVQIQVEPLSLEEAAIVTEAIVATAGVSADDLSQEDIGASWGRQIAERALVGLAVFIVLVVLFIWAYFREWKMSVAALVALAHDVIITVGIYAFTGFEVTPATVTGILTILAFSLYDTVVVFDKVRENTEAMRESRKSYRQAANLAVNQTLVRSVNTSLVALLPVGAILYVGAVQLGGSSLQDLALALFVGMAAGTYSSVCIATPLLVDLKNTEDEVKLAEKRAKARQRAAADPYASVPNFADDMPIHNDPGVEPPSSR